MDIKDNKQTGKPHITASGLMRGTGVFAILAGLLYIAIQFIHPAEELSAVRTAPWVMVAALSMLMSLFFLIGLTGIYVKQAQEAGWLGVAGYLIFSLFWLASTAFSFVEVFVLPLLATDAPLFVEGFLGIFGGGSSEADLGALPALAPIAGGLYLLGGLLLGITTFRSGVLPRAAGALLAFGAVVTLAAAVIPHPLDRILAIPMGLALIWLGYVLSSGRERSAGV
ncbi:MULTISPECIES: hypothetical protein [Paenibacillus]|uniref:DUF4386 family protein n=1 Tax=Paenibacillus campinasensis TaxID=66347 RepID=A0ABW9T994_9BACL|nr:MULTISPECIES: hypothetical protein [Paenibacillus]MUG68690.1 hypothetical protein [Paenibacillus campinasensis]PAK50626.1 hypothetical protein CHH75_17365 [Paenibacillus sp. 7541]